MIGYSNNRLPYTGATLLNIAFLRGINVGGHKLVKMEALRAVFEAMGYTQVATLLTSGNVLFESLETDITSLVQTIEETLELRFGHKISVLIRKKEDLQKLADSMPCFHARITKTSR